MDDKFLEHGLPQFLSPEDVERMAVAQPSTSAVAREPEDVLAKSGDTSAFTKGFCHAMALELHRAFAEIGRQAGFVYLASRDHEYLASHVLVESGGNYYDARFGPQTEKQVLERWSAITDSKLRAVKHEGWLTDPAEGPPGITSSCTYLGLRIGPAYFGAARQRAALFIARNRAKFGLPEDPRFATRRICEPDFANATLEVAEVISNDLIAAARAARPTWIQLRDTLAPQIDALSERIEARDATFREPVVQAFVGAWCSNLRWDFLAHYSDGMQFALPFGLVAKLQAASNVASVSFYLSDLSDFAQARLGSNNEDLNYGLYINVPAWIPIATRSDLQDSFERQLRMVIHHEMGHFRWFGRGIRDEYLAHARAVGSLMEDDWPVDRDGIVRWLEADRSFALKHDEIRALIETTKGGVRLARAWGWRRRQVTPQRNV